MSVASDAPGSFTDDFESTILRWRERALDYVLVTLLPLGIVPFFLIWRAVPVRLALLYQTVALSIYVVLLATALLPRLRYAIRVWAFLLTGFILAAVLLAGRGLEGSGRLILVVLPIHAAVLVGWRSGYAAAAASVLLFAVAGALREAGIVVPIPGTGLDELSFWITQGAMLVLVVVPALLLVTRFIGLLRRTIVAEREAATRIAEAARERRRLEQILLETGERERRNVGHQLHDGPCQQLTAALLRCRVAQNTLNARGELEAEAHVSAIADLLDASVGEIHDLARGLSPAELSPAAFPAALCDLAARVRASTAIDCAVVHDGVTRPVTAEVSSQLFRIAQEAVGNAVRHARATRIAIELTGDGRRLELLVRDDGTGIEQERDFAGMGLRIMRHRAELIGASLTVAPAPEGGTLVACILPLVSAEGTREPSS